LEIHCEISREVKKKVEFIQQLEELKGLLGAKTLLESDEGQFLAICGNTLLLALFD
jgi:hypothetical protein